MMKGRKKEVYQYVQQKEGSCTAQEISVALQLNRTNVSRYLNELARAAYIQKLEGRPVRYQALAEERVSCMPTRATLSFDQLIGANDSLKRPVQKGKAAILYPPHGLHTIIFGETGTGKTLFAECMYQFAKETKRLAEDAPFIAFNCADYAQNPQLLFSHIFGVKKGAFTGADQDQAGLVAQADGGILFLDEIHRLPPEGQEMLFTFIDKGVYRPLGESKEVSQAQVQIIGATTESADQFLTTFNRRIPMSIELPPLRQRTLEERYQIICQFFLEEAQRLAQNIHLTRAALLAFLLYPAEANIGQVKRDVKLVCAKSFLKYQTNQVGEMSIIQEDLPITVQKGLLIAQEEKESIERIIEASWKELVFFYQTQKIEWIPFSTQETEQQVEQQKTEENLHHCLAPWQEAAQERSSVPKEMAQLADEIYDLAENKLDRHYNQQARFTLALHLQTIIERLRQGETISNEHLNEIRQNYVAEFQLAVQLTSLIEERFHLVLPMAELGYLTLFLSLPLQKQKITSEQKVHIFVLMHGESTASSMLKTAQQLLNTTSGQALDMPVNMEVSRLYERLRDDVCQQKEEMQEGILLLTDMGSLTQLASMLEEETKIKTLALSMTSTLMVMEALRLADAGYTLEEIQRQLRTALRNLLFTESNEEKERPKALIVACFTGEGVAAKLETRVRTLIDEREYTIIPMQFLEPAAFTRRIENLLHQYDIKAIIGTVEIKYQNIPFFSALDLFDERKAARFHRLLGEVVDVEKMQAALADTLAHVPNIAQLLEELYKDVQTIQRSLSMNLEANVETGIMMHLAFLVDHLIDKGDAPQRRFDHLESFKKQHKLCYDAVAAQLLSLQRKYKVHFSEDELAYITQMFLNNHVDSEYLTHFY